MDLSAYLPGWKIAMHQGVIDNHPFSPLTIDDYHRRIELFLTQYQELTIETATTALSLIPVHQNGKHKKLFKAIVCFVKYLHSVNASVDQLLLVKNKKTSDELAALKRKPKTGPKQITVSATDLKKLKAACLNDYETLLVTLLSSTGLRATEASNLRIGDIDFTEGYLTTLGKGNKLRRVPLMDSVNKLIQKYIKTTSNTSDPVRFLLLPPGEDKVIRYDFNDLLNEIGARAGVKVTPHALRRTFVTLSHAKGVPMDYLRICCGHTDIKVTMGYCRTEEAEVFDLMHKIDLDAD